jgi:hypothetical protein
VAQKPNQTKLNACKSAAMPDTAPPAARTSLLLLLMMMSYRAKQRSRKCMLQD